MMFRTKFIDKQLRFGAGAHISTDDIPEGTQNFWLTTGSQDISGPKHFLDGVATNGNIYINYGGPDRNSYLYFYDNNSPTGAHIRWNDAWGQFTVNKSFYSSGTLAAGGNIMAYGSTIYINLTGPDRDSYLYFYENGSATGAYLKWDNADAQFEFSHDLQVNGDLDVSGNITQDDTPVSGFSNSGVDITSTIESYGNGTQYTGLSITLAPGTWLITHKILISAVDAIAGHYAVFVWLEDGSYIVSGSYCAQKFYIDAGGHELVELTATTIYTCASTKTITVWGSNPDELDTCRFAGDWGLVGAHLRATKVSG